MPDRLKGGYGMLIRNMLAHIGYGRELEKKSPPAVEKDAEREKSLRAEPQDTLETSAELERGQGGGVPSADSVKAYMTALKAAYCMKEAAAQRTEMAAPQGRPLSNEEKKVIAMTESKESDSEELKALKRDYRAAYLDAGKELGSAQEDAKQGNCVREDGSRQEVTRLENGTTQVKITAKDGSEKMVQFNPEFPGSVLITRKEPPHSDESGNKVPGKESQVLRRGSILTTGPGQHGSVTGKGDTVVYRPDAIGNPERIEYLNNEGTRNPFAMRYSHVEGRDGRFVKEELCQEKMPEEEKKKSLLEAEKGDEIPHIRRNIHQNGDYRDPSGRRLDGTGQTVAVLEADCDDFSGRLGSHAQMVMDTMNSEGTGVAPGAKGAAFEHRSDDNSSLLPGFSSSRRPPETMAIPDNKEALTKELDKAMRFDKRIVPDLERILDAQKKGAGISVLDMSFGEGPNRLMDQVLSLLNVSDPSNNERYARPELRKAILGESANNLPTREALEKDPAGVYRKERLAEEMTKVAAFVRGRMEGPGSGFQQALGEYRKAVSRLAEAGVTIVASAGNDQQKAPKGSSCIEEGLPPWDSVCPGASLSYFGWSPDVITVAATDSRATAGKYGDDTVSDFSSHGEGQGGWNPTVAAPGVNVKTNIKGETTEGTSFSAPYVAGIVALMKQADPALSNAEVIDILKKTAIDIAPGISADGAGEVDPEAAVREALRRAGRLPQAAGGR
ncbi:MAG: S8 family serine peptidase [Candidatus Eremiobacteraeota bacterium]|nr:S8 family serine peptidase [Candidatus Eremiobacteraeota bacterium]